MNKYKIEQQEKEELKEKYFNEVVLNAELEDKLKELQERIDKAIETINLMIYKGFTISNKETARSYMATGYNSEFGVRATELLDILKGN